MSNTRTPELLADRRAASELPPFSSHAHLSLAPNTSSLCPPPISPLLCSSSAVLLPTLPPPHIPCRLTVSVPLLSSNDVPEPFLSPPTFFSLPTLFCNYKRCAPTAIRFVRIFFHASHLALILLFLEVRININPRTKGSDGQQLGGC